MVGHRRVPDRVVTVGGGTGSYTMLSELKKIAAHLSAVVAMTDSGGSSRRLMDEFGRPLPLGDLRQAGRDTLADHGALTRSGQPPLEVLGIVDHPASDGRHLHQGLVDAIDANVPPRPGRAQDGKRTRAECGGRSEVGHVRTSSHDDPAHVWR